LQKQVRRLCYCLLHLVVCVRPHVDSAIFSSCWISKQKRKCKERRVMLTSPARTNRKK
jgi:hypothetical protein